MPPDGRRPSPGREDEEERRLFGGDGILDRAVLRDDGGADLVGVETYGNVANQVDTIPLTLSTADVTYIDSVLAGGSGTFEFFTVATTATAAARYDGNYATTPATLALTGVAAVPEPTGAVLVGVALVPLATARRRSNRAAAAGSV